MKNNHGLPFNDIAKYDEFLFYFMSISRYIRKESKMVMFLVLV